MSDITDGLPEYFEAWVLIIDGKVSDDSADFGIGKVWGVQYGAIEDAMDDIETYLLETEVGVPPDGAVAAIFHIRNMSQFPGQEGMPPCWEMDVFFQRWQMALPLDDESGIPF